MPFVSNLFVFAFLPLALILYYIVPDKYREYVLLFLSLVFYAFGSFEYLILLICSVAINVLLGRGIASLGNKKIRQYLFIIGILGNISLLIHFRYVSSFLNLIFRISGSGTALNEVALPMGISFFTFKAISYLADVYNGKTEIKGPVIRDCLYLSIFTQIQMGPLSRVEGFLPYRSDEKRFSFDKELFSDGVFRFLIGYNKKILLADTLSAVVNEVFETPISSMTAAYAWIGSICFSLQLLFDFSGYSDMAIGLSEMFGYRCPENFDHPYMTDSFSGFWRRWHITLGQWFKDYVYIPLGGSKSEKKYRVYFNLFIVWILTGLWHGASAGFLIWGFGWFVLIAAERFLRIKDRIGSKTAKTFYRIIVLFFVNALWIFFRAKDASYATGLFLSLFSLKTNTITGLRVGILLHSYAAFILAAVVLSTPVLKYIDEKIESRRKAALIYRSVISILIFVFFIWALSFVITKAYNPFAYMKF